MECEQWCLIGCTVKSIAAIMVDFSLSSKGGGISLDVEIKFF